MTFAAVGPADLEQVRVLNEAAVPAVNSVSLADLRGLEKMSVQFLLEHRDDQLAGFLILMASGAPYASANYQWFRARYADFLYVDRIVVAPNFHRLGIARGFYTRAQQLARERSVVLTCEVNLIPPNPQSMAFHLESGFQEVGQLHHASDDKLVSLLALGP
ncbi:MAG: putative GNAT superfamily acetyltransferase [Gammaproteobacteria bacterium]|jgi:predicted GNAT superfamily acetyltransferase